MVRLSQLRFALVNKPNELSENISKNYFASFQESNAKFDVGIE